MKIWIRLAAVSVGCLALGVALALVLLVRLMHTPPSHTIEALQYLVTSSILALTLGSAALLALSRFLPSLAIKIGVASALATLVAILTVLYTPWMMFASSHDLYLLIIALLYFVATMLAFSFIIATTTTRQLHALHEGAIKIASGDFGSRVEVDGADEVADLAHAFNRMSTDLEQNFVRERQLELARRDLIASVSHDLRTPLAAIRAMVEAINDGVVTEPEAIRRYLGSIQLETQQLAQLIEDLFELSRIESGNLELHLTTVPLPELVFETVEGMRVQAEEKRVDLLAVSGDAVPALALDGPRVQRVLINLIQNAVRHTPSGGRVEVEVSETHGNVCLSVADTGEGIADDDRARVFDQFYRSEKSRSRDGGGAGLGLAIARGIVEAHSGAIRVESRPGHGSRFVVIFPTSVPAVTAKGWESVPEPLALPDR